MAESYNFNVANPYQQQQEELARRQKMAEILQQQSFQPIERSSYAGIEAPISPYAGLAKMLQAYAGAKGQQKVAEERAALADEARNRSQMEGREFINALKGTPEIQMPAEELGGGPGRPAQGPDMARALEMSMSSVNPMVQSAGGALLAASLPKASKWEKVELPTPEGGKRVGFVDMNSPNPESTFRLGGAQGPKVDYVNVGGTMVPRTGYEQNAQEIPRTVSPDTAARLEQERAISDRNFNQLSANQQAQLKNDAAKIGISAQQLFFDTNIRAGGAAMPPATGPSYLPTPTVAGAAPAAPVMPSAARPVGQTVPAPSVAPVQAAPRIGMTPARPAQSVTPAFSPNAVGPTGQSVQTNQDNVIQTAAGPVQLSGRERQKLAAAALEAQQKKEQGMSGLGEAITEARNILTGVNPLTGTPGQKPLPTASVGGSLIDYLGNIVGIAPKGQNEAKRLEVISAILTSKVPRMEGQQSNMDVELYKKAAGDAGNSNLPISARLAALDTMQKLYGKYERLNAPAANQQTQSPQSNQRRYTVDY